ncbi:cell division protein FtsB [Nocardioides ginsengisegetis]|uniref:Cell division protein FtsB n=1 Tax=Nocardioides ginsengisegetis TaxID=661491 RepID=A0A7W3P9W1_9ACTN|nr:hypothetical protein [Nocardioides ginsengisegetis]MBA8803953.1 cell division protein FtsB [Nocardioides ginsengisegetis]
MTESLLAVADELYGLGLAEFTPARDARAKALKGEDAALSQAVKALKKPSTAAWVVNVLVRHETEQVEQVLAMGAALREAQAAMSGDDLRALTRQRRQLTAAVTTQARGVAASLGMKVTQAVADQVELTLTAAMVDENCSAAVRSGLLVSALATTGLAAEDPTPSVAVPEALGFAATAHEAAPDGRPDLHVVADPDADEKARAAAQELLDETEADLARATEALAETSAAVEALEARTMQLQAEIDELRRQLARLESSAEDADDELADAEDARSEAQAAVREATRARDAAAKALDRLS